MQVFPDFMMLLIMVSLLDPRLQRILHGSYQIHLVALFILQQLHFNRNTKSKESKLMRRADLHVHTHASSDASFSPEEVFSIAKARGLSAVTFSDHDTTDSIEEGQRLAPIYEVDFLPGIEITSSWREIPAHVLCFFKDGPLPSLQEFLADKIWSVGKQFNLAMLDYLQGQGKDVTVAEYDAEVEAQEESDSTALCHLLVKKGMCRIRNRSWQCERLRASEFSDHQCQRSSKPVTRLAALP